MGRAQTFNTDDAVRAARAVFWERGYESASLPELEHATGLSRSSIYHAFGSKRGLFDAAVASYLDEVVRPRLKPLTGPDVAPDTLMAYLDGLRAALLRAGTLPATSGCLLVNAANAPISRDDTVAQTIDVYAAELRAALTAGVAAALPHLPAPDQATLAEACTGLVVASLALVRVNPTEAVRSLDAARTLVRTRATTHA